MRVKFYFIVFLGMLLTMATVMNAQVSSKALIAKQLLAAVSDGQKPAENDLQSMKLSVETFSKNNGVSHVYFQQHIGDIPVYNAILGAHITRDNKLLTYNSRFASMKGQEGINSTPTLSPGQAVRAAISTLGLNTSSPVVLKQQSTGPVRYTVFDKGTVACEDIKVQLMYQPDEKDGVRLSWQVEIYTVRQTDYWVARIDAVTGRLLDKNNYVVSCDFGVANNQKCKHGFVPIKRETKKPVFGTPFFMKRAEAQKQDKGVGFTPYFVDGSSYQVYPYPVESPNHAIPVPPADARVTVNNPSVTAASPLGWHDTDANPGAEFTTTQGNNVHAYTDLDADNLPDAGSSPDGGAGLDFLFPLDLTLSPSTYRPAAVTNLFYWNNFIHDFVYGFGFDETNGNFQVNNYGNGGLGNDDVRAEAQDGSGTNNANFFTPADGQRPRMQMYVGTNPTPDVDGDLDNLVIVHEFAHGISNRLTGGPLNVACLNNLEQMGEGWSDWYGLMMTMKPTDIGTTQRPVGTYLFGQPTNGPGIRPAPYTTDIIVNPTTYDDIKTLAVPHGVGYVWASMIWDMTWKLIDKHGMATGFNVAMNIVTEGLKLQPCSPGFVDGRNAILAADLSLYAGANRCLIWDAFARRGLGFSAIQGSSNSRSDGTEAFDLPTTCFVDAVPVTISVCAPNNAVATINVGDGYSGPVTLSATGNPAGTTVSFSLNPVTAPASSTLTIGNTGAAAPGTYPITVSGTDGLVTHDDNFSLTIQSAPPGATTLVSPANGAINIFIPVLNWNALATAETYEVQVATDSGFTTIVASATGLTSPTYTPAGLLNMTTYFWRTRAVNICGTGVYSSVFMFITGNFTCNTTASTNVPVTIATTGTPIVTSTLNIAACGTIAGVKVQNLDILHTWVGDLVATLTSPLGTVINLFDRPGVPAGSFGCSGDNIAVNFDDAAILTSTDFENACSNLPAISGTYRPISPLSGFNGENMSGTWTLTISDLASGDGGSLQGWQLEICAEPCAGPCVISSATLSNVSACNNNGTPGSEVDDYFTADLNVSFANQPATGTLRIEPGNPNVLDIVEIPVASLVGNTHTFTGVRLRTTGAIYGVEVEFSVNNACVRTLTAPAVASCSALPCDISNVTLTNVTACNINGTPGNSADDYYTADLNVTFANPPATGTLRIEPGNPNVLDIVEIPVGSLVGNTHTFTGVRLLATGAVYAIEVEFSADNACVRTIATPAVNPAPQVDPVANLSYCAGVSVPSVVFTSSIPGATFNWSRTVPTPDIGLGSTGGSGNVPSFTSTNTGTAPITATFSVVASNGSGCTGAAIQFTITIMPIPTVNVVPNQTVCHNQPTTAVVFSGAVPGTIFNWTNNTPSIGLAASGSGNIGSFIAQNPGAVPVTATITVTPTVNSAFVTNLYNFTGSFQTWVVPAGVTSVSIQAFGAQGNSNALNVAGGLGGSASGNLAVAPGNTLYIYAGGGGTSTINGGFNGGGNAGNSPCLNARAGGGGGASDIRLNVNTLAGRILVAAGGGGAGGNRVSGCGRGTGGGGGAGYYGGGGGAGWPGVPPGGPVPTGGTQSTGGAGGTSTFSSSSNGLPGALGIGGAGGNEVSSNQGGNATAQAGGVGGGLIGGNGLYTTNNWTGHSGAGGSSYIGGVTGGATAAGARSGNGMVSITYQVPGGIPVICSGTPRTFTITVNPMPTITCPANIVVGNTPGQCGAFVSYSVVSTGPPTPALSYSFSGATTGSGSGSGSGLLFNVGVTTVTVTATNTCGAVNCSFTITVNDTQPPTIICPANITTGTSPGICGAIVNFNLPAVTDNCPLPGNVTLSQSTNRTTITSGVGIACGAGDNHFWRAYTLALANPLTITGVRFGVEVNGTAQVATVKVYTSAGAFPGGTRTQVASQTVNLTTASATFYTVNFATPAVVAANAVVAIEIDVPTGGMWPGANTLGESAPSYISSATCGVATPVTLASLGFTSHFIIDLIGTVPAIPPVVQQTGGLPSGSTFPVGTTTNTFLATDAAGNTATCSFTVTVNDTEPPSITCPANQTRNTDPGVCYATYTPPQPTFADNCAVTRLTWALTGATTGTSPATGINYVPSTQFGLTGTTGVGVTTITYTAADAAGNTRTCSFTVTVNDASIPVISVQPATRFVCAGSDAVFSVTASAGAGNPLAYQWQQWNGSSWVNIPGATASTLTLSGVSFTMNTNTYRVVLTGRCSVVNSGSATLYINPLPSVTLVTSIPPAILPGQSLNIISTVNPAGGSYAWYRNGQLLTSPLQQGPVLSNITVNELGTYRLVYTDLNGCVNTSADVVVSGLASDKLWVYPVPNNGSFQVRFFNQTGEQATVRVFDAKGAKVYERSVVTSTAYTQINVELGTATADGMYVVELVNAAGRRVGAKQIIVRRKP